MRRLGAACTVIASMKDGVRVGLTATAVCSVSAAPPRLLVCVNQKVRAHAVTEEGSLTAHAGEPVPPGEKDISVEALAKSLLQQRRGSLAEIEDAFVRAALEETGGNITRAAGLLGITRAQMGYEVRKGEASAE